MTRKPRVIVTRRWPAEVEAALRERYEALLNADDVPMDTAALHAAFRNADAVCPTVSDRIDADAIGGPDLRARIIASYGVGYNHIDLDHARGCGLRVTNTPQVLTDCTADLAMTLLLMVARRAGEGERHLRGGDWTGWRPTHMMGTRVTGKTLALLGFGRIARAVARRAHHGFGMRIRFFDPYPPPAEVVEALEARACDSLEHAIEGADFVSLHMPGGGDNTGLINAERLASMKPEAFLINTARGDVVDEAALVDALEAGQIAGAGLDVYEREPSVSAALLAMENVVLLPHLGSATRETRVDMGMRVLRNLDAFFAGETPPDRVD